MTLIRRVISSLRAQDFSRYFRPSALPLKPSPAPEATQWHEEPLDKYRVGGYHPVHLGDIFNNRYSVIRKLGYGAYATVWLARDMSFQRHVALKILKADAYGTKKDLYELDILRHIKAADPTHPGHKHVLHLLDNFVHKGPHGEHACMVFEPMGHDVLVFSKRCPERKMPVFVVQELARQLLMALDYLHRSCGVIHTDLKPRNIMVSLQHNAESAVHDLLWKTQEGRETEELPRLEHAITSDFLAPDMPDWLGELNFKLADYGVASWSDTHLSEWIQPQLLRAPEVILAARWDASTDIWNAGCVLYELVSGQVLFTGRLSPQETYTPTVHLAQMIHLLGPLPSELLAEGEDTSQYFDENGNLVNGPDQLSGRKTLGQMIEAMRPDMKGKEGEMFESFLGEMLKYRPGERMTAGELVRHPWLMS